METTDPLAPEEAKSPTPASVPAQPQSLEAQINTLRLGLVVLGAALLLSTVCFSLFVAMK